DELGALVRLREDDRLIQWRRLVPRVLDAGYVAGASYALETFMPGEDARPRLADPRRRARLIVAALAAIGELHRRTAQPVRVDHRMFNRFVNDPAMVVRATVPRRDGPAVDRLVAELGERLRERWLPAGWIHGGYS